MKAIRFVLGSFLFVVFFASSSMAQAQRTFVSGLGSDSNPCTRTVPCRSFTQAISQTAAGGEVIVLDTAGYGAFSITQAVSITSPPGIYAGISVFSGDGITINAGGSDTVILRGLTVNSQGSFGSGIKFNSGADLRIENCAVNGFSNGGGAGVFFNGPGALEVEDSTMRGNGVGIQVQSSSGTALAVVDQVRLEANIGGGLVVREGGQVTVRNSVASDNGTGFLVQSATSAPGELNVENCVASNNSNGILAESSSTGVALVRVSNSTVTDNQSGLINFGAPAVLMTRGNNTVEGNTANTQGPIVSYSAK